MNDLYLELQKEQKVSMSQKQLFWAKSKSSVSCKDKMKEHDFSFEFSINNFRWTFYTKTQIFMIGQQFPRGVAFKVEREDSTH